MGPEALLPGADRGAVQQPGVTPPVCREQVLRTAMVHWSQASPLTSWDAVPSPVSHTPTTRTLGWAQPLPGVTAGASSCRGGRASRIWAAPGGT